MVFDDSLVVAEVTAGTDDTVVDVLVGGALDRYFCFISSVVNGAPVLRIPDPVELSEPVLESDEALLAAGGTWVSAEVLLLESNNITNKHVNNGEWENSAELVVYR